MKKTFITRIIALLFAAVVLSCARSCSQYFCEAASVSSLSTYKDGKLTTSVLDMYEGTGEQTVKLSLAS